MAFRRALVTALKASGLKTDSGFTPHITLLHDDRSVPPKEVKPISWIATEFVLIHSLLGQTRHQHLAR